MACRGFVWTFGCLLMEACALDWQGGHLVSDAGSETVGLLDGGMPEDGSSAPADDAAVDDGGVRRLVPDADAGDGGQVTLVSNGQPTAICGGNACLRGGCSGDGKYCACPATWSGVSCADDVDECALAGTGCATPYACLNTPGGFTCAGQQADFPIPGPTRSAADFVVGPNNSTLLDKSTGLMWELNVEDENQNNYGAAIEHCRDELSAGQYGDWRLPSLAEYYTLFGQDPFPTFPSAVSKGTTGLWWTSGDVPNSLGNTWLVRVESGQPEPTTSIFFSLALVRCVRTAEAKFEGIPVQRYRVDAVADLVTDTRTLLTFQKKASANISSAALAEAQCKALKQGGRSWQLPTVLELVSTMDSALDAPPATARVFEGPFNATWTSTVPKADSSAHLCVDANLGTLISTGEGGAGCAVRCVSPGVH